MKKRNIVLGIAKLSLGAAILAGCSSKEDQTLFRQVKERNQELQTIQKTQKVIFKTPQEGESVTLLIRYLSSDAPGSRAERFLIASHPKRSVQALLNGQPPMSVTNCRLSGLPAAQRIGIPHWYTAQCVEFSPSSESALRLEVRLAGGESRRLLFSKGPKYLITKPKY